MTFQFEIPRMKFKEAFKLEKFDGEKVPGDGKVPVEVIEGGDGLDTVMTKADGSQIVLQTWAEIERRQADVSTD